MTPSDNEPDRRPPHGHPTADRLRRDIDSGKTRDKVDHPDPAAAPLGTDDEAAGNPPTVEEVDDAMRQEKHRED